PRRAGARAVFCGYSRARGGGPGGGGAPRGGPPPRPAPRPPLDSIVADYRATANIDIEHDLADREAGRRLEMPVTVLQEDWGAAMGFDGAALWRAWAPDLEHVTMSSGHFMAEEAPTQVVKALRALLAR
ncbi:alpha/beta fold hydrolase, partial [Amycolatopsis sp. NPDC059019]|uniref:alpha/beta fold hydrolase n=1 Tax=Amycolatopsis sp. NPDC059019 TaxID=3346702 RepID=UPI00366FAE97